MSKIPGIWILVDRWDYNLISLVGVVCFLRLLPSNKAHGIRNFQIDPSVCLVDINAIPNQNIVMIHFAVSQFHFPPKSFSSHFPCGAKLEKFKKKWTTCKDWKGSKITENLSLSQIWAIAQIEYCA